MLFEKQQYQEDCVDNILKVFEGVEHVKKLSRLNDLPLIQQNIKQLHAEQHIPITDLSDKLRLDILMETGTGKTFTYLQAMYQLHKQHHVNKFIIFVPRTAIRLGVIQNIKLTADYFYDIYKKRLKYYTYEGDKTISQVTSYVRDENEFSVLILTSHAITASNESNRVLTRPYEGMSFEHKSPLDAISKLLPVIVIDEPHLLKGKGFSQKYQEYFSASICLRFGATFPTEPEHKLANLVYVLDSLSAFRQYLVKQIAVSTISNIDTAIKFVDYQDKKATISFFKDDIPYSKKVTQGQDLGALTDNPHYHGVSVVKIQASKMFLSNHSIIELHKNTYSLDDDTIRMLIRETITRHFEKEERLFKQGIKALSLFFIPKVDDFRGNNPRIKRIFEEEYREAHRAQKRQKISAKYRAFLANDYADDGTLQVHQGYFSGDKGDKDTKEALGINMILQEKEQLLSLETPLRFIFSVWALQEGWDNPNIFNICKLAPSDKETSRRQQVGRGLRLAVNQAGKRQTIGYHQDNEYQFYNINLLHVIVSGQEQQFIEQIQQEISDNSYQIIGKTISHDDLKKLGIPENIISRLWIYLEDNHAIAMQDSSADYEIITPIADILKANQDSLPPQLKEHYALLMKKFDITNKNPAVIRAQNPAMVKIRQQQFQIFEKLWQQITRNARINYQHIDDFDVLLRIRDEFAKMTISPVPVTVDTRLYDHKINAVENISQTQLGNVDFFKNKRAFNDYICKFSETNQLPLSFTLNLFNSIDKHKISNNPKEVAQKLSALVKRTIHQHVLQSVDYQFASTINISDDTFYDADGKPLAEIPAHKIGKHQSDSIAPPHYLYENILYDSHIEKTIVQDDAPQIDNQKITVFAKLPHISIPTPYKNYNPDFAYYIERAGQKKLILVVETKGYYHEWDISAAEQKKIAYAERFFTQLNDYVTAQQQDVEIIFKKRLNRQTLLALLQDIGGGKEKADD